MRRGTGLRHLEPPSRRDTGRRPADPLEGPAASVVEAGGRAVLARLHDGHLDRQHRWDRSLRPWREDHERSQRNDDAQHPSAHALLSSSPPHPTGRNGTTPTGRDTALVALEDELRTILEGRAGTWGVYRDTSTWARPLPSGPTR